MVELRGAQMYRSGSYGMEYRKDGALVSVFLEVLVYEPLHAYIINADLRSLTVAHLMQPLLEQPFEACKAYALI